MTIQLKQALNRHIEGLGGGDGVYTSAIDGLLLMRSTVTGVPNHIIYRPALCLVVQGAKQVIAGDEVLHYDERQALVVNVEMPGIGQINRASEAVPYLAIHLDFDVAAMREVMAQIDAPPHPRTGPYAGMFVGDMDDRVCDALLRLVNLLDTPRDIPVLQPLLMREIYYLMLTGAYGDRIAALALPDTHTQRIAEAIRHLRNDVSRPVRVDELAALAGMSPSSFHQHFKALTSQSPVQFHKNLRLLEAKRLMVAEDAGVASAAYRVGYESASQFSREYSRLFGVAPGRDASAMRRLSPGGEPLRAV
ncbi:AraC family transcriptional regulator [Luteibacter aegosomatis]|uniref:AraC family transcriptional regulator n=1 Tax=Luteibacter aegosomatis TaxID=2911537 RepID=UPI001FFACA7D|nr:AraC family transcriptional regulator [Luteibacter aegosomatis]UPG84367.1 AraC family transcriptional regulator [Luteibacter aegosomatis]